MHAPVSPGPRLCASAWGAEDARSPYRTPEEPRGASVQIFLIEGHWRHACTSRRCVRYRIVLSYSLDKCAIRVYSNLLYRLIDTEAYRIWYKIAYERQYRIDHYGSAQEGSPSRPTVGIGNRGPHD